VQARFADIESHADIGRLQTFDFGDPAGQTVGNRDIHRPGQGNRHVTGVDPDADPRLDGKINERHLQLPILEEERRKRHIEIVAQDARDQSRPQNGDNRPFRWRFHHALAGSSLRPAGNCARLGFLVVVRCARVPSI
jgi:hypothetical protein